VLTYLAMALAVIALVIPGLAPLILAVGVAMAAVTAVVDLGLAASHNGSWADFGIALAGLLTFGAGKLLGPTLEKVLAPLKSTIRNSVAKAIGSARGITRADPMNEEPWISDSAWADNGASGSGAGASTGGVAADEGLWAGDDGFADAGDWDDGRWIPDDSSMDGASDIEFAPVDSWPPRIPDSMLLRSVDAFENSGTNALRSYSDVGGARVNAAFRGHLPTWEDALQGGSVEAHVNDLIAHMHDFADMNAALDALPAFVGRTFRGVRSLPSALRSQLEPGEVFSDDALLSTTHNPDAAMAFAGGPDNDGYLFTIDGLSGRDISMFSDYTQEAEVLFGPSTRFSVIQVVQDGRLTHVHLQELPPPPKTNARQP
jgi:hypothetical protein